MVFRDRIVAARDAERAGTWDEALLHYEAAFLSLVSADDAASDAASLFRWIGTVHRQRGDLELAGEAYEAGLAIAEAAGASLQIASALNCIGILAQIRGDLNAAEAAYARAAEYSTEPGGERLAAMVDLNLATIAGIRGETSIAITRYSSALAQFRALSDEYLVANGLNNLGMAYRDSREWSKAEQCFDEAFAICSELRDENLLGTIELNRADLLLHQERYRDAREYVDRAYEIYTRVESKQGLGEANRLYGTLFHRMARPSLAETHLSRALELATAAEDRLLEAEVHAQRALVHLDEERNTEALQSLNNSYRLFSDLGARHVLLDLDRRLDGLEQTYLHIVAAWGESIDARDSYTAGHCTRVADYACRLAEAVGFAGRELTWFRMGGFLHDVGKIEVPLEILNKPGKLTDDEWAAMKNHTVAGAAIVEKLNFPWEILPIVRNHHERWDGTGYPDRLAGEAIPFTARIMCVADVYDALTTARSYRPALSQEEALRIMQNDSGKVFDPELFAIFRSLVETGAPPRRLQLVA
jgi:putative nucleotidyltransferase with HDIG domain